MALIASASSSVSGFAIMGFAPMPMFLCVRHSYRGHDLHGGSGSTACVALPPPPGDSEGREGQLGPVQCLRDSPAAAQAVYLAAS